MSIQQQTDNATRAYLTRLVVPEMNRVVHEAVAATHTRALPMEVPDGIVHVQQPSFRQAA